MGNTFYHSFVKATCNGGNFNVSKGHTANFSLPETLPSYSWNDDVGHRHSVEFDNVLKKTAKEMKSIFNELVSIDDKLSQTAKSFSYDSSYYHSQIDACRY